MKPTAKHVFRDTWVDHPIRPKPVPQKQGNRTALQKLEELEEKKRLEEEEDYYK